MNQGLLIRARNIFGPAEGYTIELKSGHIYNGSQMFEIIGFFQNTIELFLGQRRWGPVDVHFDAPRRSCVDFIVKTHTEISFGNIRVGLIREDIWKGVSSRSGDSADVEFAPVNTFNDDM